MNSIAKESERQQSLNEQLRNKYNLKMEPFGGATGLFFQGAQRQHNLETLRHLVSYGDLVLLLTGDSGSGKTTLIAELGKLLLGEVNVVSLKPSLISSPRKLVSELCKIFDVHLVDGEPVELSIERVVQHLIKDASSGNRTLVVIDDAHKTSKESFQLLVSTFKQLSSDAGACLLVSGREDVLQSITSDEVGPESCSWIHQIQLKPFSLGDAITYVNLRIIKAGASAEPDLSSAQQKALHELGKGCPGRINRIAPAVLLDVFGASDTKGPSPKGLGWVLGGIAASLLISFVVIAYQYNFFSDYSEPVVPIEVVPAVVPELPSAREKLAELIVLDEPEESKSVFNAVKVEDAKTDLIEYKVEVQDDVAGFPLVEVPESSVTKVAIVEVVEVVEVVKLSRAPQKEQEPNVELETNKDRHSGYRPQAWMNQQSSSAYTIQVLGSRSEETAIKYIDKVSGSAKFLYIESIYKEGPWFVVISGIYVDKEAAREAISLLPTIVKKQKPWLRSVKGLQDN